MAPNMALYAPLLPVVFGQRNRGPLPFHLADVALIGTHPLLAAFGELLDLPTQRIGRSQVLALLALPAVARRLQLASGQHAALERWLERSHVAWGLDGAMKTDFGAAAVDQHSFAFGIDRMLAGYLVGQEDADWLLGDILPAHPVAGPDAQCLGALWTLIELLREWRSACAAPRSLSRWSECLQGWIDRLFLADRMDAEETEALQRGARAGRGFGARCAGGRRRSGGRLGGGARSVAPGSGWHPRAPALPCRRRDLLRHGAAARDSLCRGRAARPQRRRLSASARRHRAGPDAAVSAPGRPRQPPRRPLSVPGGADERAPGAAPELHRRGRAGRQGAQSGAAAGRVAALPRRQSRPG